MANIIQKNIGHPHPTPLFHNKPSLLPTHRLLPSLHHLPTYLHRLRIAKVRNVVEDVLAALHIHGGALPRRHRLPVHDALHAIGVVVLALDNVHHLQPARLPARLAQRHVVREEVGEVEGRAGFARVEDGDRDGHVALQHRQLRGREQLERGALGRPWRERELGWGGGRFLPGDLVMTSVNEHTNRFVVVLQCELMWI